MAAQTRHEREQGQFKRSHEWDHGTPSPSILSPISTPRTPDEWEEQDDEDKGKEDEDEKEETEKRVQDFAAGARWVLDDDDDDDDDDEEEGDEEEPGRSNSSATRDVLSCQQQPNRVRQPQSVPARRIKLAATSQIQKQVLRREEEKGRIQGAKGAKRVGNNSKMDRTAAAAAGLGQGLSNVESFVTKIMLWKDDEVKDNDGALQGNSGHSNGNQAIPQNQPHTPAGPQRQ
jgi:hypothetical protein